MTRSKTFKKVVRARMEKTGESYTAARARLLAANNPSENAGAVEAAEFSMSDEAIRRRTGRGWEEWFEALEEWGALGRTHTEIASWLAEQAGVDGWSAQSITVVFERARAGRGVGEHADGFEATASKTVAVPVAELFDAVVEERLRRAWLPDGALRERTATKPKSARYDWEDGATRVVIGFESKGPAKSVVSLAHQRLPDSAERQHMKEFWREALGALKEELEGP
jgi:uncharacterized protein YndB with AHSA1/START domain